MSSVNAIEKTYRELLAKQKNVLKLFSGNPAEHGILFPPKLFKEAYLPYLDKLDYNPHPKGSLEAREAIARYYKRHHHLANPEHIILTSGSSESFFYLFSLLAQPGQTILAPTPSYPLFESIAAMAHVCLDFYPLDETDNWSIDLEALRKKITPQTKALILVSPNNPTGAVIEGNQIDKIVALANEHGVALICDEVFSEFYFGQNTFPRPAFLAEPALCFTLNGLSKMLALPSMKLSWILATGHSEKVIQVLDALETMADTFLSCHTGIQKALPLLLKKSELFVASYHQEVKNRLALALDLLNHPSIDLIPPQGGFYLSFKIKTPHIPFGLSSWEDAQEHCVISFMKEKGVFIHPGYFYDLNKGLYFVISFLTEPTSLRHGLGHFKDWMTQETLDSCSGV